MPAPPGGKPRVLIAHDDCLIARTLQVILNRNGFETDCAFGGKHAIEAARRRQPDIFLSEAIMPEVSGIEAAVQICAIHPDCRVLLLSDEPGTAEFPWSAHAPAHDFEILRKPVPPVELLKRIRMALKNLAATA